MPLKITLGPLQIFSKKFAKILASQGAPPVSTTTASKFATSINDTSGNFAIYTAWWQMSRDTMVVNNRNNIRLLTP
jgi:hypothetical protein